MVFGAARAQIPLFHSWELYDDLHPPFQGFAPLLGAGSCPRPGCYRHCRRHRARAARLCAEEEEGRGKARRQELLERVPIREEIAYISTFTTLEPGDIIITGTPTGAGARFDPPKYLKPGDVVEVECPGIGILRNTVEDE